MKWFKHLTDSNRGRSLQHCMDKFGHIGYSTYFIILELCYEKLDTNDVLFMEKCRSKGRVTFEFPLRILRQYSRTTQTKLRGILEFYQTQGLLEVEFTPREVRLFLPNLLEFLAPTDKARIKNIISNNSKYIPEEIRVDKSRGDNKVSKDTSATESLKVTPAYGPVPVFLASDIEIKKYLNHVSFEVQKNWIKLYPIDFIEREMLKCFTWLSANPGRRPKSKRGHAQRMTTWLNNGWDWQTKNHPTQYKSKVQSQDDKSVDLLSRIQEGKL